MLLKKMSIFLFGKKIIQCFLPKAKTQLYSPLSINNLLSIRAHDADEQLLFVLNTGIPVKPNSTNKIQCC